MFIKCPKNSGHKVFNTVAHVTEFWDVDTDGNFIQKTGDGETTHGPTEGNSFSCVDCGTEAEVTT